MQFVQLDTTPLPAQNSTPACPKQTSTTTGTSKLGASKSLLCLVCRHSQLSSCQHSHSGHWDQFLAQFGPFKDQIWSSQSVSWLTVACRAQSLAVYIAAGTMTISGKQTTTRLASKTHWSKQPVTHPATDSQQTPRKASRCTPSAFHQASWWPLSW